MSKIRTIKRICEHCGKEFDFPIYESVNVTLDPELKEKVFNGDIYNCECPHCKKINTVSYPFTYHDMEKKFMVLSGSVGDLLLNKEELLNGDSPLKDFSKITGEIKYCGATGYFDFLTTIAALDIGIDWRVAKLVLNYLCYWTNKKRKEDNQEELDIKFSTLILDDGKPVVIIGYGEKGEQIIHDFPMDLYRDMEEDFKVNLDVLDPFIFNDDALDSFMNKLNKDHQNLKETKITYYLCRDHFGNGYHCLAPEFLKDVKTGDSFVIDDENSINVVKVIKEIKTNKYLLPFRPRDFFWFKYRHTQTKIKASKDSNDCVSNPELLETLISIKNNKNKDEINFPNELFDSADVILATESTVDIPLEELEKEPCVGDVISGQVHTKIASCEDKNRRMMPIYLDVLNFPDEQHLSKIVLKFNDVVKMFLMNPNFYGIMINPEDERIILNRKTINNYLSYKIMDDKEFMINLIMSLSTEEKEYLGDICYNFIKGVNVDGLTVVDLDKKYQKDESLNDSIFGIGYKKLSDIIINRFVTEVD